MSTETACAHGRLAFSEGGTLVVCLDCPAVWALIPRDVHDRQPPLGLGRGDVRYAARLMGPLAPAADQTQAPRIIPIKIDSRGDGGPRGD
jgi:hypothetical protein